MLVRQTDISSFAQETARSTAFFAAISGYRSNAPSADKLLYLWSCSPTGRRILVVEDEALLALDLQQLLDQRGAEVIGPAGSVSQALEAIHENHIDCALLDVKLGDETADAVAVALEQRSIPTVFVTGYGDGNFPQGFKACPVVEKPYTEEQLLQLIGRIFDQNCSDPVWHLAAVGTTRKCQPRRGMAAIKARADA
jgi:CheY-like chemotaxis protein